MKRAVFFLVVFCLLFVTAAGGSQPGEFRAIRVIKDLSHRSGKLGPYRALIIGINDYLDHKIPDLKTAERDAKAVGQILKERYGFQVKYLLGRKATKKSIYGALRNLAQSIRPNENVLIYYAGHGDLDKVYNDGWWIPTDAEAGNPVTYFDNVQVQKAMRSMEARHVLLISDSCYSGTLFGQGRDIPPVITENYYLNLYNEKSRWGMTSGNKEPVSDMGTEGHSVFAYQLLMALRKNEKPYLTTQEIYTKIAPIVGNNSEQTPVCRPIRHTGDQGGEFVFVASSGAGKIYLDEAKGALEELELKVGGIWQDPITGMEFMWVPGGCFQMGHTASEKVRLIIEVGKKPYEEYFKGEMSRHEVCVDGFWMTRHEVTRGHFRRFVESSTYKTDAEKQGWSWVWTDRWEKKQGADWGSVGFYQNDRHPVVNVSWNDSKAMAEWMSEQGNGKFRLPTDAEWEYAGRAGTTTARYWGDDPDDACRYANVADQTAKRSWPNWTIHRCDDGYASTAPRGSFQPNAFGLHDMLGNVGEWCEDIYSKKNYRKLQRSNPIYKGGGSFRVIRGGSWGGKPRSVRSALRGSGMHVSQANDIGFRLVRIP